MTRPQRSTAAAAAGGGCLTAADARRGVRCVQGTTAYVACVYPGMEHTEMRCKLRLRTRLPGLHNRLDVGDLFTYDRRDGSHASLDRAPLLQHGPWQMLCCPAPTPRVTVRYCLLRRVAGGTPHASLRMNRRPRCAGNVVLAWGAPTGACGGA